MTQNYDYDVLVIGAGPGGYVAAIRAAQLGLKVAVVEREHVGGICLNWGCIPTKALLKSADLYHDLQNAAAFGLEAQKVGFDFNRVIERSRKVANTLAAGVGYLLKKNKIDLIEGSARLQSKDEAVVTISDKETAAATEKTIKAHNIIIATGARARVLASCEPDGKQVWNYKTALQPPHFPSSMIILGSGAIGIEFANIYSAFGTQVTVLESAEHIMNAEDVEISQSAQKAFEARGIKILTNIVFEKLEKTKEGTIAYLKNKDGAASKLQADVFLSAVGVVPNSENLGLENLKIETDDYGFIQIDAYGRTSVKNVWAIGDVVGAPCLAHKASHEGVCVAEKIKGLPAHPVDRSKVPACTYTSPQVASVGMTQKAAEAAGFKIKVGRFPFRGNGKSIAIGETVGFVKTIFNAETGALLGAHLIGPDVTELVQGYVIARELETTEEELMSTIFPHPTLSEAMHESVLDAFGRAIHI